MSRGAWFPASVLGATLAGLLAAAVVRPASFAGLGWGVRGVVYPVLMLLAPLVWRLSRRADPAPAPPAPHVAFGLIMLPFLSDVVATWLDLFTRVGWWDDVSHLGHWFLVSMGLGLLAAPGVRPRWVLVPLLAGVGALLAVLWELLEWALFYREAGGPYADTLGDLALGSSGALLAALVSVVHAGARADRAGDRARRRVR